MRERMSEGRSMNWTGGSRNTFFQRRGVQKRNHQRKQYFQQQRLQRLTCKEEEDGDVDLKERLVNRLVLDTDKRRQIMQYKPVEAVLGACDDELPLLTVVFGKMSPLSTATRTSTSPSDAHSPSRQSASIAAISSTPGATAGSAGKTAMTFTSYPAMSSVVHESDTLPSSSAVRRSVAAREQHGEAAMVSVEHLYARVGVLETTVRELVQYLFSPDYLASK